MEAAGDFVAAAAEFSAGVEVAHDDFEGFAFFDGVGADGDAAAVIGDGGGAVGVDVDPDVFGIAGHGFVDGVVDDFPDQVVQAAGGGVADVHAWAKAHGFEALEGLNRFGVVFSGDFKIGCFWLILGHGISSRKG